MTFNTILLAVAMLGATALSFGGYVLLRDGTDRKRGWLMIIAAVVVIGNILIATI